MFTINVFIRFLKEEDVYDLYVKNIGYKRFKDYYAKGYIENPKLLIKGDFTWCYTKEGGKFWNEIHKKWLSKLPINIY